MTASNQPTELSSIQVQNMFEEASKETNIFLAYKSFSYSYMRRQLNIPKTIWQELETTIQKSIQETRDQIIKEKENV